MPRLLNAVQHQASLTNLITSFATSISYAAVLGFAGALVFRASLTTGCATTDAASVPFGLAPALPFALCSCLGFLAGTLSNLSATAHATFLACRAYPDLLHFHLRERLPHVHTRGDWQAWLDRAFGPDAAAWTSGRWFVGLRQGNLALQDHARAAFQAAGPAIAASRRQQEKALVERLTTSSRVCGNVPPLALEEIGLPDGVVPL
jgi:hypothetical protein